MDKLLLVHILSLDEKPIVKTQESTTPQVILSNGHAYPTVHINPLSKNIAIDSLHALQLNWNPMILFYFYF